MLLNPLADDKILDRSNLRQSADDNFKFDENSRKFSKQVENTVGKGEIAHYKQFLLLPQCFQKACFQEASKGVIVWEWVNTVFNIISATSAFYAFLEFFSPVLYTIFFQSYWLILQITNIKAIGSSERRMNPVAMTLFNP